MRKRAPIVSVATDANNWRTKGSYGAIDNWMDLNRVFGPKHCLRQKKHEPGAVVNRNFSPFST